MGWGGRRLYDRRTFLGAGAAGSLAGALFGGVAPETVSAQALRTGSRRLRPVHPRAVPLDEVRSKVWELLGFEPVPETVDATWGAAETTADGLRLTRLEFPSALGESVPGVLAQPVAAPAGSRGAVVCLPGTSSTAETISGPELRRERPDGGPLHGWARELARRGFVTLSLTLKGTTARHVSPARWEQDHRAWIAYGRSLMGVMVDEALRGARILAAIEAVDRGRIALTGMSLGGNVSWWGMASDPAIRTTAAVCGGVGSLAAAIRDGDPQRHSSYFYIPHLLRHFDHAQIVAACICPRPFMAIAPTRDEDMPRAGVEALLRDVSPAYRAAGHPERFKLYQPDSSHVYTPEYFGWVADWLQRFC